jgi:membrane protease YdiL (CAAX protease family)
MNFISQEYQAIKSFLKENFEVVVVLCLTAFSLVMQWYRPVGPTLAINYLFYYVVLPVLVILVFLRDNPMDYGLRIGHYRIWLYYVILTVVVSFPLLLISSRFTSVSQYYARQFNYYEFLTSTVPELFAWEYLLRGFLLFGLKKQFGQSSIIIQMVPFVLLHLGKPELETLSCVITGLWFGWIAYRGKSFWPAFIIHVFINFTAKYFVNF